MDYAPVSPQGLITPAEAEGSARWSLLAEGEGEVVLGPRDGEFSF